MKKEEGRYRCPKCNEFFDLASGAIVRCPSCASKIVLKQRQPVLKKIEAI
ncbi:MAG: DNA-directed RNA polymerase subunit P [Candidatus Diapherotrites archaeon]